MKKPLSPPSTTPPVSSASPEQRGFQADPIGIHIPKAGWKLSVARQDLAVQEQSYRHRLVSDGLGEPEPPSPGTSQRCDSCEGLVAALSSHQRLSGSHTSVLSQTGTTFTVSQRLPSGRSRQGGS